MSNGHLLSTSEKLLRRFYEPLVLLAVIDPTRGAQHPDLIEDTYLNGESKLWRNFLDQLSWLCDFGKGGDTCAAIAAQNTAECPIFWLASNSTSKLKTQDHLIWIFTRLRYVYTAKPVSTAQLENEITAHCIDFSYRRIKTYSIWLLQAISDARAMESMMNPLGVEEKLTESADDILFEELRQFENIATDFYRLCAFAHQFRESESMRILCQRHNAHSGRDTWSDIRHCIGRLGSWTKATRILILGAKTFPRRIENAQVKVIQASGLADLPNKFHLTGLHGLIERMLSLDKSALRLQLTQALAEANAVAEIESNFFEAYSKIKPRPHAELLVLEHFHRNGFDFIADDKYIGCSKHSCYCCHVYIQCHPGRFAPRPCHGNLWINWAPPIPLSVVFNESGPKRRLQQHHTFQMLQKMLIPIRQDLQGQILSRRPRRERLLDSTSGMSSVIFHRRPPNIPHNHVLWNPLDRNEFYQARASTTFADMKMIEIETAHAEGGMSESSWETPDGDIGGDLAVHGSKNTDPKRNRMYESDNNDHNDGSLQGAEVKSRNEQHVHCCQSESDDDGGVLLFN